MPTKPGFVKFIAEQIENAGEISYRKMFGEYALYCNKKVVALICDNQLFIKPTQAGKSFIGEVVEKPPYSGAKPYYLIEAQVEDSQWLSRLVKVTEEELPMSKPKKSRKLYRFQLNCQSPQEQSHIAYHSYCLGATPVG